MYTIPNLMFVETDNLIKNRNLFPITQITRNRLHRLHRDFESCADYQQCLVPLVKKRFYPLPFKGPKCFCIEQHSLLNDFHSKPQNEMCREE